MRMPVAMRRVPVLAAALGALLVSAPTAGAAQTQIVRPTEFTSGISNECPIPDLVQGPDGNVWFAEYANHAIGRITPQGQVTEMPFGDPADPWGLPGGVAIGPDANIWFVTLGGRVGRMTTQGQTTVFSDGITGFLGELASLSDLSAVQPPSITRGPDGNLWFTELAATIGRITPQGQVAEFTEGITDAPVVTPDDLLPLGRFGGITAGPDGNVWFTELRGAIGRITPQGQVTEYEAGISPGSVPQSIVAGPDGNLWFTELFGSRIGRITPQGQVSEFPLAPGSAPQGIDVGPDGALWFAARGARSLGRITPQGELTLFAHQSNPYWQPSAVTAGPGGRVWFARSGVVGVLDPATSGTDPPTGLGPGAVDRRAPTVRRLRLRGRRLSFVLSEPATLTARSGRRRARWRLRAGTVRVTVPAWLAGAARRGVRLILRDAAGNRRSVVLRRR